MRAPEFEGLFDSQDCQNEGIGKIQEYDGMSHSILQDLKECLIAQEKQRNSIKRFEWMKIFL